MLRSIEALFLSGLSDTIGFLCRALNNVLALAYRWHSDPMGLLCDEGNR